MLVLSHIADGPRVGCLPVVWLSGSSWRSAMVRQRRKRPNDLLRAARLRMVSPSGSGRSMSRQELADAVNARLARTDPDEATFDANHIGNLNAERTAGPARA